jgi:hypothetical protein
MKRTTIILSLIFALAIALSVSIPTLAANTGTTVITGTLGAHIDITADPADFSLPELIPDVASVSDAKTVTVKCNKAGWTLDVEEVSGDGFMSGTAILTNPLMVQGGDLGTAGWTSVAGAPVLESSGAKTGGTGTDFNDIKFSQTATYDDDPDTYTITVTFTATAP